MGDYVVQAIAAGQVTLIGPDGVHVLRPSYDGAEAAAAPTLTAAPAAPSILQQLLNNTTAGVGIPGLPPLPQPPGPAQ